MKKLAEKILISGIIFFNVSLLHAEALLSPICEPFELTEAPAEPEHFNQGLLFKVEKQGVAPSYVFGTMHVDDESIVNLPETVNTIFEKSDRYVMEVVFSQAELMAISQTMFYLDGTTLSSMIDPVIFKRFTEILVPYGMDANVANVFKPWAGFLTISYPPQSGVPLDLALSQRASAVGKEVLGLESMAEQMALFANIPHSDQIELLNDTVCHYDKTQAMIAEMKNIYIEQDIGALYAMSHRYSPDDKEIFENLMDNILTKRNIKMVRRMQPALKAGNSFIAVGALHLPAKEGVLYLLQEQGYTVTKVY